jgi:hypothetical protein
MAQTCHSEERLPVGDSPKGSDEESAVGLSAFEPPAE